jgi:hypothetical protein
MIFRKPFSWVTHLLGLGAGVGLAVLFSDGISADKTAEDSIHRSDASRDVVPARQGRSVNVADARAKVTGAKGTDDFAGAWKSIAARDLTINERLEMQLTVLHQWSLVDLEAAMRAALDNAWDGGAEKGGIGPLIAAFAEAFQQRPLEAWDLLQSGKLGLGAALFERQWIDSAAIKDPAFLFSVASKISFHSRKHAIEQAMRSAAKDPEMKEAMISKLIQLPDDPSADNYIAIAFNALPANEGNASEVRGKLAAATDERAKTVLLHEFASTLRDASADVISKEWAQLSPEMQARAAVAFSNGSQGIRNAPAVADMLIKTEQWNLLKFSWPKFTEYGKSTSDPKQLAEWAMTLPENGEVRRIFSESVAPFVVRNNEEAKEWLTSLPPGDWKTEATLQAYANNALYARNDEALFTWTVERVEDEGQRAQMMAQYEAWLRRRGEK